MATPHASPAVMERDPERILNPQEMLDLQDMFAMCDEDEAGFLDWNELNLALTGLGFPVTKRECQALVTQHSNTIQKGFVDFHGFKEIVLDLSRRDFTKKKEIVMGFKLFDLSGKGTLTLEDLKRLCAQVGEYLPDAVLRDMIDEADLNGDGTVNQDEFVQMMLRTNLFR